MALKIVTCVTLNVAHRLEYWLRIFLPQKMCTEHNKYLRKIKNIYIYATYPTAGHEDSGLIRSTCMWICLQKLFWRRSCLQKRRVTERYWILYTTTIAITVLITFSMNETLRHRENTVKIPFKIILHDVLLCDKNTFKI